MFDIGFVELIIIAIVSLLVIGPERLPETIRTGAAWLQRIRRSFNEIRREVEQELHNDAVMKELRKTRDELKTGVSQVERELRDVTGSGTNGSDGDGDGRRQDPPGQ